MCTVQSYVFKLTVWNFFLFLNRKTSKQIKRIRSSYDQIFNAKYSSMNGILRTYKTFVQDKRTEQNRKECGDKFFIF